MYMYRDRPKLREMVGKGSYKGTELTGDEDTTGFLSARQKAVDDLLTSLSKRFGEAETSVIAASSVIHLNQWPTRLTGEMFPSEVQPSSRKFMLTLQN